MAEPKPGGIDDDGETGNGNETNETDEVVE